MLKCPVVTGRACISKTAKDGHQAKVVLQHTLPPPPPPPPPPPTLDSKLKVRISYTNRDPHLYMKYDACGSLHMPHHSEWSVWAIDLQSCIVTDLGGSLGRALEMSVLFFLRISE